MSTILKVACVICRGVDQKPTLKISVHLGPLFNMLTTNCLIVLPYFINQLHDFAAARALFAFWRCTPC